eukprot:498960_1
MTTYQPFTEGHDAIQAQPSQPVPMQVVVVEQALVVNSRPDDGVLYWLACIFCNCCGLSLMALTLHCVAQGLFEEGPTNYGSAHSVWKKARSLRTAGCVCGAVTFVIMLIWYFVVPAAIMNSAEDGYDLIGAN